MNEPLVPKLTDGRMLARNTIFNFIGQGAPMIVAVIAIPVLIKSLGNDRFGILTLAWMVIGYFSLFDLGLGRALTTVVAEKIGSNRKQEIPVSIWTSLALMGGLGVLGAVVVAFLSPPLVHEWLKVPAPLQDETLTTFYLLAASLPLVVSTAALRGVLEAHQRFGLVNAVRIPLGLLTFLGPLAVLPFSRNLVWVVTVLIAGRLLAWVAHLWLCLRVVPELREERHLSLETGHQLLRLGSWMTVSNVIGPIMVSLDRFLIGALVSMAAVAYYTTPYEVVTKLWIISGAFIGVIFPAFSTSFVQDKTRAVRLFELSLHYIFISMFPVTLLIILFAGEGLSLWLNPDFSLHSTRIMQWLAAGVFVNSLAQIPFSLVQGSGRPDVTARLHLIELPVYIVALWLLLKSRGIEGAAIAWAGRVGLDTLIFFVAAYRVLPGTSSRARSHAALVAGSSCVFLLAALLRTLSAKTVFLAGTAVAYVIIVWSSLLRSEDKTIIRKMLGMPSSNEEVSG